jgi:Holliday junction resolvase RusA-like endonuclease
MPKAYVKWKESVRLLAGDFQLPGSFFVMFEFAAPKSDPDRRGPHTQTPDLDNLIGAVMDALCADDSHVHRVYAVARWSGRDMITIEELYENPKNDE